MSAGDLLLQHSVLLAIDVYNDLGLLSIQIIFELCILCSDERIEIILRLLGFFFSLLALPFSGT